MAAAAARSAMERAGTERELDMILVSTATPDRLLPSTACDVQALLGARDCAAYDYATACSGFLYGLSMAEAHIVAGQAETVLVAATEKMSSIVDWTDRTTCVLFGDGAGAAVVRRATDERGILSSYMKSDGTLAELLYRPGRRRAHPHRHRGARRALALRQDGRARGLQGRGARHVRGGRDRDAPRRRHRRRTST
jgi:3-oxoacyl-[acyl-carrier-protein] synthase III